MTTNSSILSKSTHPYRMPAEWESHEGTWIAWPHNKSHWPGKFKPIPAVFARLAELIAESEKVFILINDKKMEKEAKAELKKQKIPQKLLNNIFFYQIPTNSSWTRDFSPIFVKNSKGQMAITDWIFNTWGGKYPPWNLDDIVPRKIGKILQIPVIEPGIVMEGGSIETNGKGTVITTEQCLLNKNRNPQLTKKQIEKYLHYYLGATNILWLKKGIIGDDTDGHIDDIARFVNENTVVCIVEKNRKDPNWKITKKNFKDLKKMKDQNGKPFKIIAMPMPTPIIYKKQILPASYANFYITNKSVLVPTFNCPKDQEALKILQKCFPSRKVIGLDCVDLVWGLGTIHCSTQQQPK